MSLESSFLPEGYGKVVNGMDNLDNLDPLSPRAESLTHVERCERLAGWRTARARANPVALGSGT